MQYFYITNLNGDVVGITDANGDPIAEYTYDEWGKLLAITTAEDGNEEQLSIAQSNPLRYRGYYYDTETGYYYLQSRYYDPEIGRFISADSFDYINTNTPMSVNAYAYCINNPLKYSDYTGTSASGTAVSLLFLAPFVILGLAVIYFWLDIIISTMTNIPPMSIDFSLPKPSAKATPAEKA